MAFDIGEALSNFGTKANTFLESDQAPILLGQLAGAVQGGSPEALGSWQTQLGNVASAFGQSSLAAKEKLAQEDERKKYQQFMQRN